MGFDKAEVIAATLRTQAANMREQSSKHYLESKQAEGKKEAARAIGESIAGELHAMIELETANEENNEETSLEVVRQLKLLGTRVTQVCLAKHKSESDEIRRFEGKALACSEMAGVLEKQAGLEVSKAERRDELEQEREDGPTEEDEIEAVVDELGEGDSDGVPEKTESDASNAG